MPRTMPEIIAKGKASLELLTFLLNHISWRCGLGREVAAVKLNDVFEECECVRLLFCFAWRVADCIGT